MRSASSESESNRHSIIDYQGARGLNKRWYFNRLNVKLDFITDLSSVELTSKVTLVVQKTVGVVRQLLSIGLEFDIFLYWMSKKFVL